MNKILLKVIVFAIRYGIGRYLWSGVKNILVAIKEEYPNLSSEEKRQKAIKIIKQTVKREGKEIKDSIINLLLEVVIQDLKSKGEN